DDIDLSYMALKKGKSNYYFHETSVIHYKGESTVKDGTYMKRNQQAMNFFYKKHFRASFFFSIFMKMGIVFFSLVKLFRGKPKPKSSPNDYILISKDEILREKLESNFRKPVKLQEISQSFSKNMVTEIIFDQNLLDFKSVIEAFERNKNKNYTFKIIPKSADFAIGSNSSFDRGEVVKI
ncbi:MAG: glycosyltransferase family 2 protein, partial [Flavobacteriaceae bacterium]|nr:glycosyltransferase family 2 protein [Flavobacteriaceae bacterium]